MEMRDEVFSSVVAQKIVTSGLQLSDLEDIEFRWENPQLEVDAVFRPGIDILFSPTAFDSLEMGVSVENPILLDDEKDKEKSSPPITAVSERPNQPLCCSEVVHLEQN